jgi:hypothetical protein
MPFHIDFEAGVMQFACTLSYTIQRGCRQTWETPGEPDTLEDLRVHCITSIQLGTGKNRFLMAPSDARTSAAYLAMLNEWLEDNRESVEGEVWEYEAEKRYQEVD